MNRIFVSLCSVLLVAGSVAGQGIYSIGQPTAEEQFHVELINRARANPKAEGERLAATQALEVTDSYRFYKVDLDLMKREFATLSAMPPLAINSRLTDAARGHSRDMLQNVFQDHSGSDGSTAGQRMTRAGYVWRIFGENVFSYAESVWHGHAGFQVDWGFGRGGMQPDRGHRLNIHSGSFREVGVGVVNGRKGSVGPQLVTQNFGAPRAAGAFITGVAYYDLDKNGFYTPGEGIGGLNVSASGVAIQAVTSNSGGYAIPVPVTAATRRVVFQGSGMSFSANAVISGGRNAKVDYKVVYKPPVVSGPTGLKTGTNATYTFPKLPGATAHDWAWSRETAAMPDAAEDLSRVSVDSGGGYSMLATAVKFAGSRAYRFAHPVLNRSETLTYKSEFVPGPKAVVSFRSRLSWASKNQHAKLQVSTDGGATWVDVFSQSGSDWVGEEVFQKRQASLAGFSGKPIRLRLNYTMDTGFSAFTDTANGTGWYVDDVAFTDIVELSKPVVLRAPGASFVFKPSQAGTHRLSVRPAMQGILFPFGPALRVVVK